jgi:hypothetical protein
MYQTLTTGFLKLTLLPMKAMLPVEYYRRREHVHETIAAIGWLHSLKKTDALLKYIYSKVMRLTRFLRLTLFPRGITLCR